MWRCIGHPRSSRPVRTHDWVWAREHAKDSVGLDAGPLQATNRAPRRSPRQLPLTGDATRVLRRRAYSANGCAVEVRFSLTLTPSRHEPALTTIPHCFRSETVTGWPEVALLCSKLAARLWRTRVGRREPSGSNARRHGHRRSRRDAQALSHSTLFERSSASPKVGKRP